MERIEQARQALEAAREALACCYDVAVYPATGKTEQDHAIAKIEAALASLEGERGTGAPEDVAVVEPVEQIPDDVMQAARDAWTDATFARVGRIGKGGSEGLEAACSVIAAAILAEREKSRKRVEELEAGMRYIAKTWPDSSASLHARALLRARQEQ